MKNLLPQHSSECRMPCNQWLFLWILQVFRSLICSHCFLVHALIFCFTELSFLSSNLAGFNPLASSLREGSQQLVIHDTGFRCNFHTERTTRIRHEYEQVLSFFARIFLLFPARETAGSSYPALGSKSTFPEFKSLELTGPVSICIEPFAIQEFKERKEN